MLAGHVGAALIVGRAARRTDVGLFVAAALLLDLVLWPFVLAGWESVELSTGPAGAALPRFVFPWSHGLLAAAAWSALAGAATYLARQGAKPARARVAVLVVVAVLSHWVLDALVHDRELPLAGAASARIGLGLWRHLPAALVVEGLLVAAGLLLFVPGAPLPRRGKLGIALTSLLVLALTVAGMTLAPPPPSARAMAVTSEVTLVALCSLAAWFGRPRPA